MKISKRDRALLIMLVGVAILAVCWFFVVDPTNVKTDALKNENVQLQSTAELYQTVSLRSDEYDSGIIEMKKQMDEIVEAYPARIKRTDEIMYLANMENIYARTLSINTMSMAGMVEMAANAENQEGDQAGAATVKLYKMPLNFSFLCTYDGLKDMVTYIYENGEKKGISNIALSFDSETGNLIGNMTLDLYTLTGTDKEYKQTTIPPTVKGISDIFHTVNGKVGVNAVMPDKAASQEEVSEDSE